LALPRDSEEVALPAAVETADLMGGGALFGAASTALAVGAWTLTNIRCASNQSCSAVPFGHPRAHHNS
jgi:hypothetical protein